ncbi:MAG: sensor histidine kinase [Candidatus Eisenbacteria bacterium]|uniref:Oxygen sensor histidine kinase NreB n=1 Tax=Eiseniibacteriota bacterium TaxID=2212470 RepID=A0A948RSR4_UNCEI|nr:sensor histidine kinase [Candidatus Eisenbacteria bacterium]MBU1949971.1 sensor histidine kinase [Candidatus Eisenbacteria bacterium]MBU2689326.1 sensor histidine kinase [Candidatus Eisenbacteria bacterium]
MKDDILHRLTERVKELTALHRTSRLLQNYERPTGELMNQIAALLPGAWQYPDVAAARIRFRGNEFLTKGFHESAWTQRADFATPSGEGGSITIAYLEARPVADEGPFLAEERDLIESLAEMLRSHLEHLLADEALRETRDALEAQVLARTADLRRLASRLTLAEEKERRRIASDLHDHIGQALAFIKMRMREFQGNAVFSGFEEALDEILRLLDQTIRYTRALTGEISPPVLYELGLGPALDWLADYFTTKGHFRVRLRTRGQARELPEEMAIMLFKSARELLNNSLKHSGEREASLDLTWEADALTLCVGDRGCGFDPALSAAAGGDGFGLFSIRERFSDLGGGVTIASAPGAGCRVTLNVPLRRRERP